MTNQATDLELRRLRLRIGRLRRRIDRRIRAAQREGRRLTSWRTYVERYPGYALLAALGVGLTAAAGLRPGAWARALGLGLIRRAATRVEARVFDEIARIWTEAAPTRDGGTDWQRGGEKCGRPEQAANPSYD